MRNNELCLCVDHLKNRNLSNRTFFLISQLLQDHHGQNLRNQAPGAEGCCPSVKSGEKRAERVRTRRKLDAGARATIPLLPSTGIRHSRARGAAHCHVMRRTLHWNLLSFLNWSPTCEDTQARDVFSEPPNFSRFLSYLLALPHALRKNGCMALNLSSE